MATPQPLADRAQSDTAVALANETLQALELLCSVFLVGTDLVEDLDVVLGVLVLECGSETLGLLSTISPLALELLNDAVEGLDGATSGVKTTTHGTVGTGVGVDEVDEVLLSAGAVVWERLSGALGEVLDGRVG
ncbi:Protein disulfide-isomerase [Alternaria alternata]|nr:Protein disulfide-isomerase [Alternaria alternata]